MKRLLTVTFKMFWVLGTLVPASASFAKTCALKSAPQERYLLAYWNAFCEKKFSSDDAISDFTGSMAQSSYPQKLAMITPADFKEILRAHHEAEKLNFEVPNMANYLESLKDNKKMNAKDFAIFLINANICSDGETSEEIADLLAILINRNTTSFLRALDEGQAKFSELAKSDTCAAQLTSRYKQPVLTYYVLGQLFADWQANKFPMALAKEIKSSQTSFKGDNLKPIFDALKN